MTILIVHTGYNFRKKCICTTCFPRKKCRIHQIKKTIQLLVNFINNAGEFFASAAVGGIIGVLNYFDEEHEKRANKSYCPGYLTIIGLYSALGPIMLFLVKQVIRYHSITLSHMIWKASLNPVRFIT